MLSIATISFNQAAFLGQAMESVLSQLGRTDQYIVIDGGSSDESEDIIRSHRSQLHYWHSRPDNGPADALNQAIELAGEPYFYYINADDYVLPGALERLRRYLRSHPVDGFAYGHGWTHHMTTGKMTRRFSDRWHAKRYARGLCSIVQQSTVLSRAAIDHVGGFNRGNRTCWDGELLFDLSRQGFPAVPLPFDLGVFRIHDASITGASTNGARYHQDRSRIALSIGETYLPFESRPSLERAIRRAARFGRTLPARLRGIEAP